MKISNNKSPAPGRTIDDKCPHCGKTGRDECPDGKIMLGID